MSTKIYNGVRFVSTTLEEVYQSLTVLRPGLAAIQYDEAVRWMAQAVYDAVDRRTLDPARGEEGDEAPFMKAFKELFDRQAEIKKSGYRDTEVDFEFSLSVLPYEGRIYGIVYTERKRLRDFFMNAHVVKDFSYWDSSDGPDSVPDEEWNRRGATWEGILGQDRSGRPAACGLSFEMPTNHIFPKAEDVLAGIPPLAERALRQAKAIVRDRRFRMLTEEIDLAQNPDRHWRLAMKAIDYAGTDEGKAETDAETARIAPLLRDPIDRDALLGRMPPPVGKPEA